MTKTDVHAHFIARLRAARTAVGLSQTALGMRMGLTKDIASTRINRYETGASEPDLRTAERMAKKLGVSVSWLVCTDPKLADLIEGFGKLDADGQDALLATLQRALRKRAKAVVPRAEKIAEKVAGKGAVSKKAASKTTPAKKAPSAQSRKTRQPGGD